MACADKLKLRLTSTDAQVPSPSYCQMTACIDCCTAAASGLSTPACNPSATWSQCDAGLSAAVAKHDRRRIIAHGVAEVAAPAVVADKDFKLANKYDLKVRQLPTHVLLLS